MMQTGNGRLGGYNGTERARGLHVAVAREMRRLRGRLSVVLLLGEMKRRYEKKKKG
jgi:hypothetical protein